MPTFLTLRAKGPNAICFIDLVAFRPFSERPNEEKHDIQQEMSPHVTGSGRPAESVTSRRVRAEARRIRCLSKSLYLRLSYKIYDLPTSTVAR